LGREPLEGRREWDFNELFGVIHTGTFEGGVINNRFRSDDGDLIEG